MELTHRYASPLGGITMACDSGVLTGLWFDGQKHFGEGLCDDYAEGESPAFELADRWLDRYFSGQQPDFTPPLRPRGSAFRRAVWEALLSIPYGRTATYGEIARTVAARMGLARMSAQAVGGAVGHNPIALIIPCHRVVGKNGSLTGYAGGIERKARLLTLEGVDPTGL